MKWLAKRKGQLVRVEFKTGVGFVVNPARTGLLSSFLNQETMVRRLTGQGLPDILDNGTMLIMVKPAYMINEEAQERASQVFRLLGYSFETIER